MEYSSSAPYNSRSVWRILLNALDIILSNVAQESGGDTHFAILEVDPSASLRIVARRSSMRFQYFSLPLHSLWIARYHCIIQEHHHKQGDIDAYHECNPGAKLDSGATRCGVNNQLGEGKDVGVGNYTFFNLWGSTWVCREKVSRQPDSLRVFWV